MFKFKMKISSVWLQIEEPQMSVNAALYFQRWSQAIWNLRFHTMQSDQFLDWRVRMIATQTGRLRRQLMD